MKELLVPVGNMSCLYAAVNNGADAVYAGGLKYGARAFANNFSEEELIEAVKYCHLYGVKIYITVNTLIHEKEMTEVLNYIKFLYKIGVDAVIVQDIGLISLIHDVLPEMEIHASTQVHTTNGETVSYLESLGVKRVVMARETSVDVINNIETNLEIEAFIHGALCISYSGECLMSSYLLNRSGNRGECAQLCRMEYDLYEDNKPVKTNGKYLLSTKDLNTSPYFNKIMESNIYSLKIEGRMKSSEYVGCVTRFYRKLMDTYYETKKAIIDKEIFNDLCTIFSRTFTKGFINNELPKDIVNIKTCNHQGTPLGKVIKIDKKYIYIKLTDELCQGDGIRITSTNDGASINYLYNEDKLLTNEVGKNKIALINNTLKCRVGDIVNKTLSVKLIDKYTKVKRYIPVDIDFIVSDNLITLTISDGENTLTKTSDEVAIAKKLPTSKEVIKDKLSKLGGTVFTSNNINVDIPDNVFINVSVINHLRQEIINELTNIRSKKTINYHEEKIKEQHQLNTNEFNISVLVRNEEQLNLVKDLVDRIYVIDEELYNKYSNNEKVYLRTSRIGGKTNMDRLLVTELSNINSGTNRVLDYYLNITNHYSVNAFKGNINTLSVELDKDNILELCKHYLYHTNFEIIIYGTIELMLMKYCMINNLANYDKVCTSCKKHNYELVDKQNNHYKIITDNKHITHLMAPNKINKIEDIAYYYNLGIHNFRLELLDESNEEIIRLINEINHQKKNYC